jgi:hypothetical protein
MAPPASVPAWATPSLRAPRKREISSTATIVPHTGMASCSLIESHLLVGAEKAQFFRSDAGKAHAAERDRGDGTQHQQAAKNGNALHDVR